MVSFTGLAQVAAKFHSAGDVERLLEGRAGIAHRTIVEKRHFQHDEFCSLGVHFTTSWQGLMWKSCWPRPACMEATRVVLVREAIWIDM